jgi:hypothetical protein
VPSEPATPQPMLDTRFQMFDPRPAREKRDSGLGTGELARPSLATGGGPRGREGFVVRASKRREMAR